MVRPAVIDLLRFEVAILAAGYLLAGVRGVLWALVLRTIAGIILNLILGRIASAAEKLIAPTE